MARKDKHIPFEDERLRQIHYCVRKGFRKLVPADRIGWPGYTAVGAFNRDEDVEGYLTVDLSIFENTFAKKWLCLITIADGDDFIYQRFRDFTIENWTEQLALYMSINEIDKFVMQYLELEGFR